MKNRIVHTQYSVYSEKLTRDRVFAFVSDLHEYRVSPIFERVMECGAEALLVAGDCIHLHDQYERGIRFLTLCAKEMPVYVSVGNHEIKSELDYASLIRKTGAILLDDSWEDIGEVRIGGLTSGSISGRRASREPNYGILREMCKTEKYTVLLCHHPEYYDWFIKGKGVDLTLSGHAHGGQWRFFGRGIYAPGQGIFPKHTSGFCDDGFIVSRGIGNKYPLPRIGNQPEVITLRLCAE